MPIILYLFLGGTGAGACLVLAAVGLLVPADRIAVALPGRSRAGVRLAFAAPSAYRKLFVPAYGCALVVLLLGLACLIIDLGRADRLLLLLSTPTFSHIVVGAYSYAVCFGLALALALPWSGLVRSAPVGLIRALEAVSIPVAIAVMVYSGLLLQSLAAVPLWTVAWLPVLFVLSSVSCGIALVVGIAHLGDAARVFPSLFRRMIACDALVVALEAAVVAAFLAACGGAAALPASGTAEAAASSYAQLVAGSNAELWWVGFVGFGLAVPLVLEVLLLRMRLALRGLTLGVAACVLFGGFVMRFCIVEAGAHPVLALFGG